MSSTLRGSVSRRSVEPLKNCRSSFTPLAFPSPCPLSLGGEDGYANQWFIPSPTERGPGLRPCPRAARLSRDVLHALRAPALSTDDPSAQTSRQPLSIGKRGGSSRMSTRQRLDG